MRPSSMRLGARLVRSTRRLAHTPAWQKEREQAATPTRKREEDDVQSETSQPAELEPAKS